MELDTVDAQRPPPPSVMCIFVWAQFRRTRIWIRSPPTTTPKDDVFICLSTVQKMDMERSRSPSQLPPYSKVMRIFVWTQFRRRWKQSRSPTTTTTPKVMDILVWEHNSVHPYMSIFTYISHIYHIHIQTYKPTTTIPKVSLYGDGVDPQNHHHHQPRWYKQMCIHANTHAFYTYVHVCLQAYMVSVFLDFPVSIYPGFPYLQNFWISRYTEIQEMWKFRNTEMKYIYLFVGRQIWMYV